MSSRWLLVAALGACGSDPVRSGVAGTTPVGELTSSDVQQFCDWAIDLEGGFGHSHRCENGTTLDTPSVAICVDTLADLTCTDPIADLEDCLLAVDGDLCQIPTESACAAYIACGL